MRIFHECFESPLVNLFFAVAPLVAASQVLGKYRRVFASCSNYIAAPFPAFTYAYKTFSPQPAEAL
jgi:hypothetical protein